MAVSHGNIGCSSVFVSLIYSVVTISLFANAFVWLACTCRSSAMQPQTRKAGNFMRRKIPELQVLYVEFALTRNQKPRWGSVNILVNNVHFYDRSCLPVPPHVANLGLKTQHKTFVTADVHTNIKLTIHTIEWTCPNMSQDTPASRENTG